MSPMTLRQLSAHFGICIETMRANLLKRKIEPIGRRKQGKRGTYAKVYDLDMINQCYRPRDHGSACRGNNAPTEDTLDRLMEVIDHIRAQRYIPDASVVVVRERDDAVAH